MTREPVRHHPPGPVADELHPVVYAALIALTAWFVLSVWTLFGTKAYTSVTDAVVTVFFTVAVAIPVLIWLTWRNNCNVNSTKDVHPSFRHWRSGEFQTWTGGLKASQAAIEILLPIAAVAFGITAFGIVFYLTANGAA